MGDIRKMFHSIHLKHLEQHCHRFLWRDLQTDQETDVYVMTRVNMGDTPAPAISTEAMYKTAGMFETDSPKVSNLLRSSSRSRSNYVDDLIDSQPSTAEALKIARETEDMLAKGGFAVKCWQFTGESSPRTGEVLSENVDTLVAPDGAVCTHPNMLKGTDSSLRVLGLGWNPVEDTVVFEVTLNFSKKKKGTHIGPCLKKADLPQGLPLVLTRRIVLSQVMMIFDLLGFVCPYTLLGKIYLRETWSLKLGWDDPVPIHLRSKWVHFFFPLFQLEQLRLDRCLRPPDSVSRPWLIIFSDGSDLAYGFAAYIIYERFRNINRVIWVVARLKNIARNKTFSARNARQVTAQHLKDAEDFVVKNIQKTMECELKKSSSKKGHGGRYAKLKPVQDASGIWVVGERLTRYNSMTPDSSLQRLLPSKYPATRLFTERVH